MTKMETIPTLEAIRDELARLNQRLDCVDMTPKAEWLTVKAYAARVGRSPRTIDRRIAAGTIDCVHEGGERMIFFNPAASQSH